MSVHAACSSQSSWRPGWQGANMTAHVSCALLIFDRSRVTAPVSQSHGCFYLSVASLCLFFPLMQCVIMLRAGFLHLGFFIMYTCLWAEQIDSVRVASSCTLHNDVTEVFHFFWQWLSSLIISESPVLALFAKVSVRRSLFDVGAFQFNSICWLKFKEVEHRYSLWVSYGKTLLAS